MLRKIFNKILNRIGSKKFNHIAWISTWIFNLRCFDLKTAVKLPVYIYNNVDISYVNKITIESPHIYKGMIRMGIYPIKAHNNLKWRHTGTTIFHGAAEIDGGCIIEGDGLLEFGNKIILGESCKIMCTEHVKISDHVNIGYESTIMDTDYHYILNLNTNEVRRKKAAVIIGEGTWISSTCKIMKGSVIPPKSIIAGGSLINKDFSNEPPCQIYAGTPAKPIRGNSRRIVNRVKEREIDDYFEQNPDEKKHILTIEGDLDEYCWSHYFRWGN